MRALEAPGYNWNTIWSEKNEAFWCLYGVHLEIVFVYVYTAFFELVYFKIYSH